MSYLFKSLYHLALLTRPLTQSVTSTLMLASDNRQTDTYLPVYGAYPSLLNYLVPPILGFEGFLDDHRST